MFVPRNVFEFLVGWVFNGLNIYVKARIYCHTVVKSQPKHYYYFIPLQLHHQPTKKIKKTLRMKKRIRKMKTIWKFNLKHDITFSRFKISFNLSRDFFIEKTLFWIWRKNLTSKFDINIHIWIYIVRLLQK